MVGHTGIKNIRPENGKSSALKRPIQRRNRYMKQKGREERARRREFMFVCFKWGVLSGRGLCDEPITRPEESYRLWCVVV